MSYVPPLNLQISTPTVSNPVTSFSGGDLYFKTPSTGQQAAGQITPLVALGVLAAVLIFKKVL